MTDITAQQLPQYLLGREMGKLLCEALGLPPERIRRITLRNPIDDLTVLEVERILTDDEGQAIKALLLRYRLVPAGKVTDAELDVQPSPDGTLIADISNLAEPYYRPVALAPQALIRDVTRHSAAEPKCLTNDPQHFANPDCPR